MKTGTELITEERQRQISKEGWTPEHDDEHDKSELVWAANGYSYMASGASGASRFVKEPPFGWPFEDAAWKPSEDPVRNLVKAGALLAAEIDRLNRAALTNLTPATDKQG